jgi:hypothetical protein
MKLTDVKERFDLLTKVNCSKFVTIAEFAKELKTTKTDLLKFIQDNTKHFQIAEEWSYKTIKKKERLPNGRVWSHPESVKNKSLGLCVERVFLDIKENPENPEWLEFAIKTYAKSLWLSQADNYGHFEGYYIEPSTSGKPKYYGNTQEKLEKLKDRNLVGVFSWWVGGYGDCAKCTKPYGISDNSIKILKNEGWTFYGERTDVK